MARMIVLKTTREGLLELYHRRGTIDPFRSPATRPYRRMFIRVILVSALLIIASLIGETIAWLMVFAWILQIGAVAMIIYSFVPIVRQRLSVYHWATESAMSGEGMLTIHDEGYHLKTNGGEFVVKWSAIQRVEIHDDYLTIKGSDERLFAKSSMTDADYAYFSALLRSKVLQPMEVEKVDVPSNVERGSG